VTEKHAIPDAVLALLADPETHEKVRPASDDEIERLRDAITSGRARRHDAGDLPDPSSFEGAFLSQGGRVAYLVFDGVPSFLIDDRIELDEPLCLGITKSRA